MTRKDISVAIIAIYLLSVNLICEFVLFEQTLGTIIGNAFGLGTVAIFVFWVKSNKKVDKWFETKI